MKRSIQLLSTLYLVTPLMLSAQLVEHNDITAVSQYINLKKYPHTVVIFDIDNTLGCLTSSIGNDEWVYQLAQYIEQTKNLHGQDAFDAVISTYCAIQMMTPMRPIQKEAPAFLAKLNDLHIPTYALTARSFELIPRTLNQLKNMHYLFSPHSYAPKNLYLSLNKAAYYKNGVLFAGKNNKGDLLMLFFNTLGIKPDQVIFVDDKEKNVKDVEVALMQHNIAFVGMRYNRLDEKIAQFNIESTFSELKRFYKMHPEVTPIPGLEP